MRRREFIAVFSGATAWWSAVRSQTTKIPRIGVLWAPTDEGEAVFLPALRQGFSELGYVEGKNYILENRFAAKHYDRFERLATELVEARVDVFVATTLGAAFAAQRATTTIPVVFVAVGDPVGFKFVDSLARPGHNLTGLSNILIDLSGKRMEFFKEAVPGLSEVALLSNPRFPMTGRFLTEHRAAARSLGLKTARQTYLGLAGLIMVDDGDHLGLPHDYGMDDLPVIIQDRTFESDGGRSIAGGCRRLWLNSLLLCPKV